MSDFDFIRLARPEIRTLRPYASARALADSAGILLNANENPYPPAGDDGLHLNRYPDPQPAGLKQRLSELYDVDDRKLLITRGSDEGIDLLVRTFCRPGQDSVLICPPCFGMYALSATVQGAPLVVSPLVDQGRSFAPAPDLAERAAACRLVFLCSPNNPTGNAISADVVTRTCQSVGDNGLVVIDEAYVEFRPELSRLAMLDQCPNLVVLRTLSKAYGLAGCRLGVVIADPAVIELLKRIIAPYPLPTPTVAQALKALGAAALEQRRGQLDALDAEKARLLAVVDRHRSVTRVWPGEANFLLVRALDGTALVADAAKAGIRLRDQSNQPGLENCVRITVGSADENSALIAFLRGWTA
ncbi:MAG: histidinol-phosphate transaminase [Wenzhouxiangellaceae bacterium]